MALSESSTAKKVFGSAEVVTLSGVAAEEFVHEPPSPQSKSSRGHTEDRHLRQATAFTGAWNGLWAWAEIFAAGKQLSIRRRADFLERSSRTRRLSLPESSRCSACLISNT